jgi:hypothetical protein
MITSLQEVVAMAATEQEQISAWVRGRLPESWFVEPADVSVDREEIIIIGRLALPEGVTADTTADEAERRFEKKVAWGASVGETRTLFTHIAAPVMTRLRQPERQVLDTLVEAGVARSRADALGWCVRLVGEHTEEWLGNLREAMTSVQRLRTDGPQV